jgi:hypothetical protein
MSSINDLLPKAQPGTDPSHRYIAEYSNHSTPSKVKYQPAAHLGLTTDLERNSLKDHKAYLNSPAQPEKGSKEMAMYIRNQEERLPLIA